MEKSLFTRTQHTIVYTAGAAVAAFMIAVIGGVHAGGAIIWGLLVGCILLLLRRQDIFVESGEDVLDQALIEARANMRTHASTFSKYTGMEAPSKVKAAAAAETTAASAAATKPAALDAPRDGKADDLSRIEGIGPKVIEDLHSKGIYHLDQISAWTKEEVAWMDQNLKGLKNRVSRDNWVEKAKKLVKGED